MSGVTNSGQQRRQQQRLKQSPAIPHLTKITPSFDHHQHYFPVAGPILQHQLKLVNYAMQCWKYRQERKVYTGHSHWGIGYLFSKLVGLTGGSSFVYRCFFFLPFV
jgi:hypothetical protein